MKKQQPAPVGSFQASWLIPALMLGCFSHSNCKPSWSASPVNIQDVIEYYVPLGANSKHARVLPFPKDYFLGGIIITGGNFNPGKPVSCLAQGKIVVPAGKMVKFTPGQYFYKHPEMIETIPADGLDMVKCTASDIEDLNSSFCDKVLARIGHLKGLTELNLDRSDSTDKGLAHAADLPNLQKLSIFMGSVDGTSLKQLSTLKQLHSLSLSGNRLQEENLKYLPALPQLEYLYVGNCWLSDAGVKHLSKCTRLTSLKIGDNPKITDESIQYFLAMKKLRFLSIRRTSITIKGVLQLKALPLVGLDLPGKYVPQAQADEITRAFPGVKLVFPGGHQILDSDTKAIFAPLH